MVNRIRHSMPGCRRRAWSCSSLRWARLAATARAETPSALLRCVQDRYGALRDLSAAFTQESRVASLGRTRTRAGRLFFQAPGRMRWEYDGPEPQLIVADGKQLWFHRPERKQVVVQPMDAAFTRQTPLLFLLGRGDFAAEFTWDERELAPGAGGRREHRAAAPRRGAGPVAAGARGRRGGVPARGDDRRGRLRQRHAPRLLRGARRHRPRRRAVPLRAAQGNGGRAALSGRAHGRD